MAGDFCITNNCYYASLVNTGTTEESFSFVDCSSNTQTVTLLAGDTAIINFNILNQISGNTSESIIADLVGEVDTLSEFQSCCEDRQKFAIFGYDQSLSNTDTIYGEQYTLSETSEIVNYNCSELIDNIPVVPCPPISGTLVSVIINPILDLRGSCEECLETNPCPPKCYGLLACDGNYELIKSTNPALSGYVDTYVNIEITSPISETPQTLFLVKDLGFVDCESEYTFTYTGSTEVCDCQCYTFVTPNEPFITSFVDCDDNLLQVFLPTGKTTSICSLVRPIFDTQIEIPIKLGGLCIDGNCPEQPAVTIRPRNECDVLTIFPMEATCVVTHPSTIKAYDGQAQLLVNGGTPPYTITWDTGSVGPIINNLNIGSYGATITDFYGDFTINTTCVLTGQTIITTTTTTTSPLPTYGDLCVRVIRKIKTDKNESLTIDNVILEYDSYLNGKPTWISNDDLYRLYWNTGSTPNYWEISGSTLGTTTLISYTTSTPPLIGWNGYGDPTIQSVTIFEGECSDKPPVMFTTTPTSATCGNNGTMTILASGGDGIYEYSIDNGTTFSTTNIFQNLSPGTYIVHVRDGLGETVIQNVIITQTPTPLITLTLQITTSNTNGNTFTVTSNTPNGYTVSFDVNNTSNFSYYQDTLTPMNVLPSYNNIVTVTNPAVGNLQIINTNNNTNPVTNVPLCGNVPLTQYNTTKQYSKSLTISNGETITGTFTDQIIQSTLPTTCKVANGSFAITITNAKILECECCNVRLVTQTENNRGGSNLTPLT